jgi:hypothetical protein
MAKQKPAYFNKGKSTMLENVTVKSPKKEVDTRSKAPVSSLASKAIKQYPINAPVPKVSQLASPSASAGPKKLGRLATAASDATSSMRGAANMAFGKNKSKTTGGKILERGARLAATGLGLAGASGVAGASKAAISTASKAGSLNPIGHAITTGATVAAGQAMYKNRSAESTRKGLLNPGKGATYFEGTNFDKPFSKAGRDYPLSESPNPEFKNQK